MTEENRKQKIAVVFHYSPSNTFHMINVTRDESLERLPAFWEILGNLSAEDHKFLLSDSVALPRNGCIHDILPEKSFVIGVLVEPLQPTKYGSNTGLATNFADTLGLQDIWQTIHNDMKPIGNRQNYRLTLSNSEDNRKNDVLTPVSIESSMPSESILQYSLVDGEMREKQQSRGPVKEREQRDFFIEETLKLYLHTPRTRRLTPYAVFYNPNTGEKWPGELPSDEDSAESTMIEKSNRRALECISCQILDNCLLSIVRAHGMSQHLPRGKDKKPDRIVIKETSEFETPVDEESKTPFWQEDKPGSQKLTSYAMLYNPYFKQGWTIELPPAKEEPAQSAQCHALVEEASRLALDRIADQMLDMYLLPVGDKPIVMTEGISPPTAAAKDTMPCIYGHMYEPASLADSAPQNSSLTVSQWKDEERSNCESKYETPSITESLSQYVRFEDIETKYENLVNHENKYKHASAIDEELQDSSSEDIQEDEEPDDYKNEYEPASIIDHVPQESSNEDSQDEEPDNYQTGNESDLVTDDVLQESSNEDSQNEEPDDYKNKQESALVIDDVPQESLKKEISDEEPADHKHKLEPALMIDDVPQESLKKESSDEEPADHKHKLEPALMIDDVPQESLKKESSDEESGYYKNKYEPASLVPQWEDQASDTGGFLCSTGSQLTSISAASGVQRTDSAEMDDARLLAKLGSSRSLSPINELDVGPRRNMALDASQKVEKLPSFTSDDSNISVGGSAHLQERCLLMAYGLPEQEHKDLDFMRQIMNLNIIATQADKMKLLKAYHKRAGSKSPIEKIGKNLRKKREKIQMEKTKKPSVDELESLATRLALSKKGVNQESESFEVDRKDILDKLFIITEVSPDDQKVKGEQKPGFHVICESSSANKLKKLSQIQDRKPTPYPLHLKILSVSSSDDESLSTDKEKMLRNKPTLHASVDPTAKPLKKRRTPPSRPINEEAKIFDQKVAASPESGHRVLQKGPVTEQIPSVHSKDVAATSIAPRLHPLPKNLKRATDGERKALATYLENMAKARPVKSVPPRSRPSSEVTRKLKKHELGRKRLSPGHAISPGIIKRNKDPKEVDKSVPEAVKRSTGSPTTIIEDTEYTEQKTTVIDESDNVTKKTISSTSKTITSTKQLNEPICKPTVTPGHREPSLQDERKLPLLEQVSKLGPYPPLVSELGKPKSYVFVDYSDAVSEIQQKVPSDKDKPAATEVSSKDVVQDSKKSLRDEFTQCDILKELNLIENKFSSTSEPLLFREAVTTSPKCLSMDQAIVTSAFSYPTVSDEQQVLPLERPKPPQYDTVLPIDTQKPVKELQKTLPKDQVMADDPGKKPDTVIKAPLSSSILHTMKKASDVEKSLVEHRKITTEDKATQCDTLKGLSPKKLRALHHFPKDRCPLRLKGPAALLCINEKTTMTDQDLSSYIPACQNRALPADQEKLLQSDVKQKSSEKPASYSEATICSDKKSLPQTEHVEKIPVEQPLPKELEKSRVHKIVQHDTIKHIPEDELKVLRYRQEKVLSESKSPSLCLTSTEKATVTVDYGLTDYISLREYEDRVSSLHSQADSDHQDKMVQCDLHQDDNMFPIYAKMPMPLDAERPSLLCGSKEKATSTDGIFDTDHALYTVTDESPKSKKGCLSKMPFLSLCKKSSPTDKRTPSQSKIKEGRSPCPLFCSKDNATLTRRQENSSDPESFSSEFESTEKLHHSNKKQNVWTQKRTSSKESRDRKEMELKHDSSKMSAPLGEQRPLSSSDHKLVPIEKINGGSSDRKLPWFNDSTPVAKLPFNNSRKSSSTEKQPLTLVQKMSNENPISEGQSSLSVSMDKNLTNLEKKSITIPPSKSGEAQNAISMSDNKSSSKLKKKTVSEFPTLKSNWLCKTKKSSTSSPSKRPWNYYNHDIAMNRSDPVSSSRQRRTESEHDDRVKTDSAHRSSLNPPYALYYEELHPEGGPTKKSENRGASPDVGDTLVAKKQSTEKVCPNTLEARKEPIVKVTPSVPPNSPTIRSKDKPFHSPISLATPETTRQVYTPSDEIGVNTDLTISVDLPPVRPKAQTMVTHELKINHHEDMVSPCEEREAFSSSMVSRGTITEPLRPVSSALSSSQKEKAIRAGEERSSPSIVDRVGCLQKMKWPIGLTRGSSKLATKEVSQIDSSSACPLALDESSHSGRSAKFVVICKWSQETFALRIPLVQARLSVAALREAVESRVRQLCRLEQLRAVRRVDLAPVVDVDFGFFFAGEDGLRLQRSEVKDVVLHCLRDQEPPLMIPGHWSSMIFVYRL